MWVGGKEGGRFPPSWPEVLLPSCQPLAPPPTRKSRGSPPPTQNGLASSQRESLERDASIKPVPALSRPRRLFSLPRRNRQAARRGARGGTERRGLNEAGGATGGVGGELESTALSGGGRLDWIADPQRLPAGRPVLGPRVRNRLRNLPPPDTASQVRREHCRERVQEAGTLGRGGEEGVVAEAGGQRWA